MKFSLETNDPFPSSTPLHRRAFLSRAGIGLGSLAVSSLLARDSSAALGQRRSAHGLPGLPHFAPKAKRVIFLYMAGGPSQLEMFDYKPKLLEIDGQTMPDHVKIQPVAQLQGQPLTAAGPICAFQRCGNSGQWISELLPWHQRMADDLCIVRSTVTEQINHDPAHTILNTGSAISGRPSMGSWVTYGLGSEADDLPGFVVLTSKVKARNPQPIASRLWSAGFLPSRFQGVEFNSVGDPVLYLRNPDGIPRQLQAASVSAIRELDRHAGRPAIDPELEARIAAYETAFRMQVSVPELVDLSDESAETLDLYGATLGDGSFASNCLLARRLAERGVRFIQLFHRDWDHHDGLQRYMQTCCESVDRAAYALIADLKQRGMLDETLVVFGGEFGRSPMVQMNKGSVGRDHHIQGFSMWLAGGGIKPGVAFGQTDELGYRAVENPVHVRDLHATMLHLLGIDHQQFTYRFQGLEMRLSGVEPARVVKEIIV
jgi:hypothetical protein